MADIKISELTALASMTDTALVPVVDGATTKKITGLNLKTYFLNGNAASVTNGVYTTGNQTIDGNKTFSNDIIGDITGNAGTVTNGVVTTGSYSDPSWITSLSFTKLTNMTRVVEHITNILAGPTTNGDGSSIAITDNYQTERVNITNSLGDVGRATLPNVSVTGKIVILTSTSNPGQETYVDRYRWPGNVYSYVSVSNSANGVVILMSLGANGWKQIQTND